MGKNKEIKTAPDPNLRSNLRPNPRSGAALHSSSFKTASVNGARSLAQSVVDLTLPPQTLFRPGRSEIDLGAAQSWSDVNFLDEPCCACCGFPFDFDEGPQALCGRCSAKPPAYDRCRAAFAYDTASRALVLRFKHGGQTEGLSMFAAQMARAGRALLSGADGVMPVPLHFRRRVKRRYNQSTLLARALARRTHLPLLTDDLMRRRATPSQGGQTAAGRRKNVSGAFALRPTAAVKGKHIILVDDVMTTGATLEACARTLKRGGAARVDALVLSRVVKPAAPAAIPLAGPRKPPT